MRLIDRAARTAFAGVQAAVATSRLGEDERRAVAVYLLVTACNVPGAVAADAAHCTRQNISKLVRAVEDRRDNAAYDRQVSALEQIFGVV